MNLTLRKNGDDWLRNAINERQKIDVVFGGAYAIKEYYMESDNPRQMRGASQLLLDIIGEDGKTSGIFGKKIECIREYLEDIGGCLYYSAGATFFGIVPDGKGSEAAQKCEELFEKYTLTATVSVISKSVESPKLDKEEEFPAFLKDLLRECDERRFLKIPPKDLPWYHRTDEFIDPNYKIPPKNRKYSEPYIEYLDGDKRTQRIPSSRCSRCNIRDIEYRASLNDEGEFMLCPSCAHKEFRGSYIQRNRFRDECREFGRSMLAPIFLAEIPNEDHAAKDTESWFGTTDSYADHNGDIALLYADINDLGSAWSDTLFEKKIFNDSVAETIRESLYSALLIGTKQLYDKYPKLFPSKWADMSKYPARFEIIAVGGDDICVLLPGEISLHVGTLLLKEFDTRWRQKIKDKPSLEKHKLTISSGIAVAKAQTPLQAVHKVAEQLLTIAKKKAYQLREEDKPESVLDILILYSDAQWAMSIESRLRKDLIRTEELETGTSSSPTIRNRVNLTLRPYTVSEAEKMLDILCKLPDWLSTSTLYKFDEASKQCCVEEGNLFYQYHNSKQDDKGQKNLSNLHGKLHRLLEDRTGSNVQGYLFWEEFGHCAPTEGSWISPWTDLTELHNQLGAESKGGGSE